MLPQSQIIPYISVSDVAQARRFYEDKVGLKPREEYAGGVQGMRGLCIRRRARERLE